MKNKQEFADLPSWREACLAAGVRAVALRQVAEIRPVAGEGHSVVVGRARWADVIGYRDGVVYRVRLNEPPDGLRADLEAAGFTVRQVSDNVT